jgi:uncharacterized protein (DUF433 family)
MELFIEGGNPPMATVLETSLVRTPDVCGGRLRIDGTRMTVNQIVVLHRQGMTAEDIVAQYPQRTLEEIFTVLAWYHAHKDEFDHELAAEDKADEEERALFAQSRRK